MRSFIASMAFAATSILGVSAQEQSGPFSLFIDSHNETLNGLSLSSCHSGAGIETLCLATAEAPTIYNLNYSSSTTTTNGVLVWTLKGANFEVSQPWTLQFGPFSNTALGTFGGGGYGTQLEIAESGLLGITKYYDEVTGEYYETPEVDVSDWKICTQNYGGYKWSALHWVIPGTGKSFNPSCQDVAVVVKESVTPGKAKRWTA